MGFSGRLRQLMTYSQQKAPNLAAFTDRMRQESILQAQMHSAEPKPFLQNNLPKDLLGVIDILFGPMGQPSEAIGDKLFLRPSLPTMTFKYTWSLGTRSVFKRC